MIPFNPIPGAAADGNLHPPLGRHAISQLRMRLILVPRSQRTAFFGALKGPDVGIKHKAELTPWVGLNRKRRGKQTKLSRFIEGDSLVWFSCRTVYTSEGGAELV